MSIPLLRRQFLTQCATAFGATLLHAHAGIADDHQQSPLLTRGVVLVPEDLTLTGWPARAKAAGLSTLGIHHQHSPQAVVRWIKSDAGQQFLEACRNFGLEVEYELHAIKELLPRDLFAKNPDFFRMDDGGERMPDSNCCVNSDGALEIIAENAAAIAQTLRPTTDRYFYWGDDGLPWCHCPKCRELSPSEQSLIIENRICRDLRHARPGAQVAHLAYLNSLQPPEKIRPVDGIFLEYAPIKRRYDVPFEEQRDPNQSEGLNALDANLKVFPKETAQVLEYWLDVSRFSRWKKPAVKLPWNPDVLRADLEAYRKRGIRHITSFAVWIDADYRDRFGDLDFIGAYGTAMRGK